METIKKVGDPVALEFASADATTAAAMTIKDANGATRTLAAHERLMVDTPSGTALADNDDPSTDILVTVFSDNDGDGAVDANERILAFRVAGVWDGDLNGYPCNLGITPKVITSGTGTVVVTGMGRITIGKTQGTRPGWQASLVPGA